MKSIKFLIVALLATTCITTTAQTQFLKTTTGKLVVYGSEKKFSTTDSTLSVVDTLTLPSNTGGLIEVSVVGTDSVGNSITGKQIYRYKKAAGTITLATVSNLSTMVVDAGLGTATFTLTATASNNLQLKTKGKLGQTVRWHTLLKPFYP